MVLACAVPLSTTVSRAHGHHDPLPSWRNGSVKQALLRFVQRVSRAGSPDWVPPEERLAVFDNDGTLWPEHPIPFQLAYVLEALRQWVEAEPALAGDPMLELLRHLRAHGFRTAMVSGGGTDFMRAWSERVYGIAPDDVVGSTAATRFELREGRPVLIKTTDQIVINDRAAKPVGIERAFGRRPIAAFGNSDGDLAMLQYTTIAIPRPSLGLLVHHTDARREVAYDARSSSSGAAWWKP